MNFFFFLFTFFVIKLEADAIEIVCDYQINHVFTVVHPYACIVQSVRLLSSNDCKLTSVTGDHKPGKSNDDVTFFHSSGKTFNCFPKMITKFFKNIDAVASMEVKFATIDKSDLQQFGDKLKYLNLYNNKVEVIASDLFEYTPNIGMFFVHYNQIKYVGSGAFGKLQKLSWLSFTSNPCNSGSAGDYTSSLATNRPAINSLIATIESQCNDQQTLARHRQIYPITTEAPTTTTTARNYDEELRTEIAKLNEEHKQKIDKLNEEAAKSKAEIDNLKAENAKLLLENEAKNQNEALNEKNKEIIEKLTELEAKIDRTEAKINESDVKMEAKFDLILENFSSINGTCSAFDYKLDLVNRDCISRPCHRQP